MLDKLTVQNGGDVSRCANSYNVLGLEVKHLRSKKKPKRQNKQNENKWDNRDKFNKL